MWVLVFVGFMAISGYPTESACREAAKHQTWYVNSAVMCIPASQDAAISVNTK